MKPLDIVQVRPEVQEGYKGILDKDDRFVYLGDINQMPGHGMFVLMGSGRIFTGLHTSSFRVIEDEGFSFEVEVFEE
jgi:hypothetical protein